jgi:hypothetical protein
MNRRGLDTIAARWGDLSKSEQNNVAELIARMPEASKQAWTSDTSTAMAEAGQHYLGFFWRNDKPGGFAFTVKKKASEYADMIHEGLKYVLKRIQNNPEEAVPYYCTQLEIYGRGEHEALRTAIERQMGKPITLEMVKSAVATTIVALELTGHLKSDEYNGTSSNFPLPWNRANPNPITNNGKRPPRLSDILLEAREPAIAKHQPTIRAAEKFCFPLETFAEVLAKLEEIGLENLDLPQFGKLPFQQCWCEFPGHEGNAFGVLYEADNTYQRGAIRLYRLLKTELCWFGPFSIRFDFTDNPNADKIADRFAFVAEDNAPDDDLKAFYTEIMQDGLLEHLVAFTVLNFSKQAAETTKENLAGYNRLRRSLGQKKLTRQEYHIVRINTAALAETTAPLPRQSSPTDITKGQHSVRGHYRHYKSGLVLWINEHRRGHGECKSKRRGYIVGP